MSTREATEILEPIKNQPTELKPRIKATPPRKNPFRLPAGSIFLLRRQEEEQMRLKLRALKIHEKSTHSSRVKAKQRQHMRGDLSGVDGGERRVCSRPAPKSLTSDPLWRKAFTQAHSDRESISDYISNQREMFRVEYSMAVKQEVIQLLAEEAALEDKKLAQAENFLEQDASMFDDFLKENDRNSALSIKIAEQETKNKLEKVVEIKQITGKIMAVKSDISRNEEVLKEYTTYQDFLLKLSPPEWQEKQRIRREMAEKIKAVAKEKELAVHAATEQSAQPARRRDPVLREMFLTAEPRAPLRPIVLATKENTKLRKKLPRIDAEVEGNLGDYEDPQIYFTDSRQLLELMGDLEEQNLSLIQNAAEMEEALEHFRVIMDNTHKRTEQEMDQLTQQIDIITHTIQRETEKVADLELKARLFSFGEYNAKDQEIMLEKSGKKVAEVYKNCLGNGVADQSPLQMLTAIEGLLGDLLDRLETVPRQKVLIVERAHEKERRIRQREEKVRLQKQAQEERLQWTLRRAQADIKKPTGRKLMPRSQPPTKVDMGSYDEDKTDAELERNLYFFT